MRHPVSTIARSGGGERLRGAMSADVVWGAVLPAAPENAGPRASEDPDRVLMATPTRTRALIHEGRPPRGVAGIIGEGRDGTAQALVARPAKHDGAVLAGGMRDGRQAGLGRELFGGGEASPSSARICAALTAPLRGRLCTSGPSGCCASAAAMAAR